MTEHIVDLSDVNQRNLLLRHIGSLEGSHRISITKERKRRSDGQNKYFHAVVVGEFVKWCREQGNPWSEEEAKDHLKRRFLTKSWVDEKTGEIFEATAKTSQLTTVEFMDFIDLCRAWILDFCGIDVEPPNPYYKREAP